jgi:hypothetical protein
MSISIRKLPKPFYGDSLNFTRSRGSLAGSESPILNAIWDSRHYRRANGRPRSTSGDRAYRTGSSCARNRLINDGTVLYV